jgi:leucine dehydrogenase
MSVTWELPDFDEHEGIHFYRDPDAGLSAIIAVHSTKLGPAAGGVRFWHYAEPVEAITDALRLSRGMSFKNAMARLPMGGGKAVILADETGTKTPEMLRAFGRSIAGLGGQYITAEDVGMNDDDMVVIGSETAHVSGLPVGSGEAGGDPGPSTALGVFLGVKAAAKRALGSDDMAGVRVAVQGIGSVGGGLAKLLAAEGAHLTLADVDQQKTESIAAELGAQTTSPDQIVALDCDIFAPCALGAILDEESIAALRCAAVAGGANNQLARPEDGRRIHERGILFAPDYVINAGGIINVGLEYLGHGDRDEVESRIGQIPERLEQVWRESESSGDPAADVADRIARELIGRA